MSQIRRGFTLIELMVVITIISIITIITVSQFQTAKKRANDVARKSDLNSLNKALQMYYADFDKFPPTNALTGQGVSDVFGSEFKDDTYSYMKVVPQDKILTSYPFCYKVDSLTNPKKFALFAQLENKTDSDCTPASGIMHAYSCNGINYCFAIVSPNSSLDVNGNLQ